MDPNFKAISEISTLERELVDTDLLLVSYLGNSGTKAGYETRNVEAIKLQGVLSAPILSAVSAAIWNSVSSRLSGDLVYTDLSDLEQQPDARRPLSSYALRDSRSTLSVAVSDPDYAISSLQWNDSGHISSTVGQINIASIAERVVGEVLARLGLDGRLELSSSDGNGVKLAVLTGSKSFGSVYVGDPRRIVSAESSHKTGEKIATVYYGGTTSNGSSYGATNIYNGCDQAEFSVCGTKIGQIGSLPIYNGVEITAAAPAGSKIATISRSGKKTEIYNGVEATPETVVGDKIATVCEKSIYNGVEMTEFATVGQPVFKLNGKTCYNGCGVVDKTSGCGNAIAEVNGTTLYSGFTLADDLATNATKIRFADGTEHLLRGGLKLGAVEPLAEIGDVIAKMTTDGAKTVQIRNGVDAAAMQKSIDDTANQLAALKADVEKQLADLKTWISSNFLSKTASSRQTVSSPVTFDQHITGKCDYATEAYSATKAKWA